LGASSPCPPWFRRWQRDGTWARVLAGLQAAVRDVLRRLIVRADPAQRVDVHPSAADRSPSPQWSMASPAGIYLTIFADQTCPAS
jgi:hypothetical protein